jgi:hypothetical protein
LLTVSPCLTVKITRKHYTNIIWSAYNGISFRDDDRNSLYCCNISTVGVE